MFRRLRILKLKPLTVRRRLPHWTMIVLVLLLTLVLRGAGQVTPAEAASANQVVEGDEHIRMRVIPPADPLCVGQEYSVRVVVVRTATRIVQRGPGTEEEVYVIGRISGVKVESSVQDESIGTLSPRYLWTGWDVEQLEPEAEFKFKAKKAGRTNLIFEALIPRSITRSNDSYISSLTPIQVVNCEYDVTIFYNMLQFSHGSVGNVWGILDTRIKGSSGETFSGTGVLDSSRTQFMAPCSFTSPGFKNPTTITGNMTGSPGDRQLELNISFTPGTSSSTITCPLVGVQNPTTTEDPTNWLSTSATFPENGGGRSFRINYAQWLGNMTIFVKPVNVSSP